jgi:hypothetical protein
MIPNAALGTTVFSNAAAKISIAHTVNEISGYAQPDDPIIVDTKMIVLDTGCITDDIKAVANY